MKKDIILAGVGGQGILSNSYIICSAALNQGWNFKQAEVHGMSQRGGAVQAHLRLSDGNVNSDLVPMGSADLILSVEPLESLRYAEFLSETGVVVSSITPFINIPNYPALDEVLDKIAAIRNHVLIDSEAIARMAGSVRAQNMVMLGAASDYIGIDPEEYKHFIAELFAAKGEKIIETNYRALDMGRNVSRFFTACIASGLDPLATRLLSAKGNPESLDEATISAWDKAFDVNRTILVETLNDMGEYFNATADKATQLGEGCSDTSKVRQILTS